MPWYLRTLFLITWPEVCSLRLASLVNLKHLSWPPLGEIQPESEAVNTALAINNTRKGTASVWLFHTTHNAGTSLQRLFSRKGFPWNRKGRGCFIEEKDLEANPHNFFYNDVCGEQGLSQKFGDFDKMFYRKTSKLVTIYPIRHPIYRNLAHDDMGNWKNTPDGCFTDNYGMRKLLGLTFDVEINRSHIEAAKARAASFDIVADMTQFSEGLKVICDSFGWHCAADSSRDKHHIEEVATFHLEHPDIYERWIRRNAPEIELYEFAKMLSRRKISTYSHHPKMDKEVVLNIVELEDRETWICPSFTSGQDRTR